MNFCNEIFKHDPDAIAIIGLDSRYTYGELDKITNKLANCLTEEMFFKKGDCIIIQSDNCPQMVMLWIAAVKSGGTAVLLSNEHSPTIISEVFTQTNATMLFSPECLIQTVLMADRYWSDVFETVDVEPTDICEITLTSGTGGNRQNVVKHSHENTIFAMRTGTEFRFTPTVGDVFYCTAHLSFSYGIAAELCIPLMYGAATIIAKKLSVIDTLNLIKDNNVTVFYTAPAFYRIIMQHDVRDYFNSVNICFSGGDYLPEDLKAGWKEKSGKYLTNIIGAAETQWIFACAIEDESPEGSLGKIIPPYIITSVDDKMHIKTPFIELDTSDNIEVIDDNLYFYGRSDDLISTTMGKYNPYVVEYMIMESGLVTDVFARQYDKMSMKFTQLFCIGDPTKLEELKQYCEAKLPQYLVPKKITYVETLPRTLTGKAQRKTI